MPPSLTGRRYYEPSDQGQEAKIRENHERRDRLRNGEERE
jgi:replication-associated recombination protein RarA